MVTLADLLGYLFYGATIASLAFFVHKVLWLVQYKRLQRGLVDDAVRALGEGNDAVLAAWDEHAARAWKNALGQADIAGPSTFVRRVEQGLSRLRDDMRKSRRSLEDLFGDALAGEGAPAGKATVLSLRRLTTRGDADRYEVAIDLAFPELAVPRALDKHLYELDVTSRYGLVRRALVFFSGVADVVYSSQHVARMSQNAHVPTSVLVRRLALVFLVLAVVLVDMVTGARALLAIELATWLRAQHVIAAVKAGVEPAFLDAHLPTMLAWGLWLAGYGSIYLALYAWVRQSYQGSVRRLRELAAAEPEALRAIHRRQVGELVRWGREYGKSLDGAAQITVRHAETLIDHYVHRLRRRVAAPSLLEAAKTMADSLFLRLPEARGEFADLATSQAHSLRHHGWPRREEMGYQVKLAQYRAAWQALEMSVNALRGERPEPAAAHELWGRAIVYATLFAPLLPSGAAEGLYQAYAQMVIECVADTDRDLAELDGRLRALERTLQEQLDSARGLVISKVELAGQRVQAEVAMQSAEIIRVREQARLEAMAFEI